MSFVAGAIIIGASLAVAGGGITAGIAGSKANKAGKQADKYAKELAKLEANRQEIINPGDRIVDLSASITNPYANLQVATQAAKMQSTEADISLANTLDTLRSSGAGAGGATALAREASRGKQEVSASIESQEAANSRLRAQGEQTRQQLVLAEQQRVQQGKMMGDQFAFGVQESRDMVQLDRVAGQQQNQEFLQAQYQQQMMGAISSMAGSGSAMVSGFSSGMQ